MESAPRVLEVKPTEGCHIWIRFEDGLEAELDFSDTVPVNENETPVV